MKWLLLAATTLVFENDPNSTFKCTPTVHEDVVRVTFQWCEGDVCSSLAQLDDALRAQYVPQCTEGSLLAVVELRRALEALRTSLANSCR